MSSDFGSFNNEWSEGVDSVFKGWDTEGGGRGIPSSLGNVFPFIVCSYFVYGYDYAMDVHSSGL